MILLARASAGLALWAFGFSLLYALHGFGCESRWNEVQITGGSLFRWVMVSTWALLCGGAIVLVWLARRLPRGFERRLGLASAWTGCAATVITGAPVALTSACT